MQMLKNIIFLEYLVKTVDEMFTNYVKPQENGNSCGQSQLKKYRCKFEPFKLSFELTPYNNTEVLAVKLGRETIK